MLCLFLLSSCSSEKPLSANRILSYVNENADLFTQCALEMEKMGEERIYVAMEVPEEQEGDPPRLVSYGKESDTRTEITNPVLQEALERFGFRVIYFQTASDARRCVIFSFEKETFSGVVKGVYYSFDALPCAWWGRKGELTKKDNRYLQLTNGTDGSYMTFLIRDSFYYFEKQGSLLA